MNYAANMSAANVSGANISGGANAHYPVAGVACGSPCSNSAGAILVLFILLVIITRTILF
ncbi:hypothetical protein [Paenibacillus sp. NPDC057967]|uniref:hypothetical protein n=1 Tax=Paenibacillus sp. NPDC057967 TaxID=3346293 RepID=UPI0036DE7AC0